MVAVILSSSIPARPTNGTPVRSSFCPGPSPMSITPEAPVPSPNTTLVRRSARPQRVQVSAWAARSFRPRGRDGEGGGDGDGDGEGDREGDGECSMGDGRWTTGGGGSFGGSSKVGGGGRRSAPKTVSPRSARVLTSSAMSRERSARSLWVRPMAARISVLDSGGKLGVWTLARACAIFA